jgi:hypothetical protein
MLLCAVAQQDRDLSLLLSGLWQIGKGTIV